MSAPLPRSQSTTCLPVLLLCTAHQPLCHPLIVLGSKLPQRCSRRCLSDFQALSSLCFSSQCSSAAFLCWDLLPTPHPLCRRSSSVLTVLIGPDVYISITKP